MEGRSIPITSFERLIENVRPLAETVWSNLASVRGEGGRARILFTSTEGRAGNTLIAAACALGLARNTRRQVTLVEANLARPSLAHFLGVEARPGLGELLAGMSPLDRCLRTMPGCPELAIVPAGAPREPVPGELAARGAVESLEALCSRGSYVIIDAPPLIEANGARALLNHVDGAVLVVRARSSSKRATRETVELIEEAGVELYGSVLNRFRSELPFSRA